jgi:hypothetical protein
VPISGAGAIHMCPASDGGAMWHVPKAGEVQTATCAQYLTVNGAAVAGGGGGVSGLLVDRINLLLALLVGRIILLLFALYCIIVPVKCVLYSII